MIHIKVCIISSTGHRSLHWKVCQVWVNLHLPVSTGRMTMLKMSVHQIQGQHSSDQEESLKYILEDNHGIIYFELL